MFNVSNILRAYCSYLQTAKPNLFCSALDFWNRRTHILNSLESFIIDCKKPKFIM